MPRGNVTKKVTGIPRLSSCSQALEEGTLSLLMRRLSISILFAIFIMPLMGGTNEPEFADDIKASLRFREQKTDHYPHVLEVYLHMENIRDGDITWFCNYTMDIEAELLDASGKPAVLPPSAMSMQSNPWVYRLPFGSSMDWLISCSGGINMRGNLKDSYALIVGGGGWLIPKNSLSSYTLRIRLYGIPWKSESVETKGRELPLLLDIPATKITLSR